MDLPYELHAVIICKSWVNDRETSSKFNSFVHLTSVRKAEVHFRKWKKKIEMLTEGRAICKVNLYYILFVDFVLPKSTGFDLLKRFKEDPYLQWVYVVIVNDRWNAIDEQRCRDQHVYMCFDGPLLPLNVLQVRLCILKVDEITEQRIRQMQQLQPQSGSSLSKTEMALAYRIHNIIICRSWVYGMETSSQFNSFVHLNSIRKAEVHFRFLEEMIKIQKEGIGPKVKEYYVLFIDFIFADGSSGLDLFIRFKANPYLKWVNVIMVNEKWNDGDEQRCMEEGVFACFAGSLLPSKVEQLKNRLLQMAEIEEKKKQHKTIVAEFKYHGLIISAAVGLIPPVHHLFSTFNSSITLVDADDYIKQWESKGKTMFQGRQLTAQVKEKEVFIIFIDCYFIPTSPSGFDLLKRFKKEPHLRHIHFVMLSNGPPLESDVFDRCMAEGAFTSIDHPLTVTKIEQAIQQIGLVAQVTL